jgi:superfamily II DNA or RNA helicase
LNTAIYISNVITIKGPCEPLEKIQEDLTIPNPKYTKAVQYSKWKTKEPPTLEYWRSCDNGYYTPRGYLDRLRRRLDDANIPYSLVDETHTCPDVDIDFTGKLKPHQVNAAKDILSHDLGVLESPTGSGKTVIALKVIAKRKQPTLIIVHTKELMYQWRDRALQFTDIKPEEIGLIGDGQHTIGSKLTIAIVNSLKNCAYEVNECVGQVIVDECHHIPSTTFKEILTEFSTRFMLGLSATPYRRDKLTKLIYFFTGDLVHRITAAQLQAAGQIMCAQLVPRFTEFDFDDATNDYSGCITALVNDPNRNDLIVQDVISQAGRQGIALVTSDRKDHCEAFHSRLIASGIDAKLLTGSTPKKERTQVIQDLNKGEGKVLVATAQLIGEGFDLKSLSSIFMTTPIRFSGKVKQCVGRIVRTDEGKETPLIFDYVDVPGVLQNSYRDRQRAYRSIGVSQSSKDIAIMQDGR